MKKGKSFETLQHYGDLAIIIEDLIDEIQKQSEALYSTQSKQNQDQTEQNNQQKLQEQIELLVKRVDEQCQNYAKYTLDYLFQLNSNNLSPNDVQLKNILISIKAFFKKSQNKGTCDKLRHQITQDISKIQQAANSIQYYDEIKKNNGEIESPKLRRKKVQKEEGFISSDSDYSVSDQSEKQNKITKKAPKIINQEEGRRQEESSVDIEDNEGEEDSPYRLKQIIKEQDKYILELKEKVANRECILSEITYGYMKDVSHWKEIFNRKDRDFQNCFEVSYFEPSIIYDDKIREILNSRLQDLKIQCENKMYQMQKKFKRHQEEFEKLQETLFAFMNQNDPFSVAKTLFAMEPNPHKIWRILQDQVGNAYFFRLFEQQRPGFGIRYKEIDELISSSKASNREYEEFKKHMKFQMEKLVERSQQEIEFIRKEVGEKEKEIEQIRKGFSQDLEKVRQETIKQMEEQFTVREEKLYEEFEERRKDIYEQLGNRNFEKIIEESQLKLVFQKWSFAAKLMKIKAILDEQNENQSIEQKQDFLKKFILRQISKPTQPSKKFTEIPGSLFNSKRIKGKLSKRQSIISLQSRVRLQSGNYDEINSTQNDFNQKNPMTNSSKIISNQMERKQSNNSRLERRPSDKSEKNQQLEYSDKKMVESQVTIIENSDKGQVKEEDNTIISEESHENKKQTHQEEDIEQIFELEQEIDLLNLQIKEKQTQQSGLEEKIIFLNKQVDRVTQELQQQRDYNAQCKNDNRELKLKINLYEDTFNEIAQKTGFHELKIEEMGDSQNKRAKNFMKSIGNSNKQDQQGFMLALETQKNKNEVADMILTEKFKEKGTCTKIYGINQSLSELEQGQKDVEDLLVADNLDLENAVINQRETRSSKDKVLIEKDTQTDLEMKDIDFKTKKKLKRNIQNSPNAQKSSSKKDKDKNMFEKFDIDELERNSSHHLSKLGHQLESPQYMKARVIWKLDIKYNGKHAIQDEVEEDDSSDDGKKDYNKRNSVWERLFNDQFDRRKREEELKKQLESIEEQHWQEILKILNLYSQKQFDTENEIIKPYLPKYVPRKRQQQMQQTEQKRCYTPNLENKYRANSSNKETLLNQSSTFNVMQVEKTPPSQQQTMSSIRPKTRADHFYKKIQTEPSQIDLSSNHIYISSSGGKDKYGNDLINLKTEQNADHNVKTTPFEYFADMFNKQSKKQHPDNQYKQQIQFLQKYPQLDKTLNQHPPIFPVSSIPTSNSNKQQITRNRSYSINRQKNNSMSDKKEQQNISGGGQLNKSFNQNAAAAAPTTTAFYQTQNTFYYSKYSQMHGKKAAPITTLPKQNILPNS